MRKAGTPKTGGRTKGTPNKVTADLRGVLQSVLDKEMTPVKVSNLLKKLEPQARLSAMTKLLEFCTPKLQSISVQAQIEAEYEALEKLLTTAPDEAVDKILERLETLKANEQKREDK